MTVGMIAIPRDCVVGTATRLHAGYSKYPDSIFSVSMEKLESTKIRPLEAIEPRFFSFPARFPVSVMTELSVCYRFDLFIFGHIETLNVWWKNKSQNSRFSPSGMP